MKNLTILLCCAIFITGCQSTAIQNMNSKNQELINQELSYSIKHHSDFQKNKNNYDQAMRGLSPSLNELSSTKKQPERFSINAHDISAKDFFLALSDQLSISIIPDPKISGNITINLKDATLQEIFSAISSLYGFTFVKTNYGYLIEPQKIVTKIYHINRLDLNRKGVNRMKVSGVGLESQVLPNGTGTSTSSEDAASSNIVSSYSDQNFWSDLKNSINLIVGNNENSKNNIYINTETDLIVVNANEAAQEKVSDFLRKTQLIDNRQVILEAKLLEVNLNQEFSSGIDWKLAHFDYTGNTGIFHYSSKQNSGFDAAIRLLSTQGKVTVLSSPKVSTLNNQQALIKIGTDSYYVTQVNTGTTPINNSTATLSQNVNIAPFFSGIALDILPEVENDGYISLHVHPMVSRVTQQNLSVSFSNNNTITMPVAQSTIREIDTVVRAKNNQIIVIGGLMESAAQTNDSGPPVVDQLNFFTNHTDQGSVTELVILIKPVIVNDHSWIDDFSKDRQDIQNLNEILQVH